MKPKLIKLSDIILPDSKIWSDSGIRLNVRKRVKGTYLLITTGITYGFDRGPFRPEPRSNPRTLYTLTARAYALLDKGSVLDIGYSNDQGEECVMCVLSD